MLFSQVDNIQGVSANIMLGQIIKGGTGECDILLDEEMILNNEFEDENIKDKRILNLMMNQILRKINLRH